MGVLQIFVRISAALLDICHSSRISPRVLHHNWVTFQMRKLIGGTKLSATTLLDTLNLGLNIEFATDEFWK